MKYNKIVELLTLKTKQNFNTFVKKKTWEKTLNFD